MGNRNSNPQEPLYLDHLTRNQASQNILRSIYQNNSNPPVEVGETLDGDFDNIEIDQFPGVAAQVKKANPRKCFFSLDKNSLKLHQTEDPAVFSLSFRFTSTKPATISIFVNATDVMDDDYNTQSLSYDQERYKSFDAIEFEDGVDQEFPANLFKLDTKLYLESELTTVKDETYPIIIQIEESPSSLRDKNLEKMFVYCVLKNKGETYKMQVVKQKFQQDDRSYLLNDVYEIVPECNEGLASKDCTICLSRHIDTIVLPCRHMYLCSHCAKDLRRKDLKKCSICRKFIKTYVKLKQTSL